MFYITIDQYETIVNSFVDAYNVRDYDNDSIHDHIETIDNDFTFVVHDNHDKLRIDNIESLFDSINEIVNRLRVNRFVELNYTNAFHMQNDDDSTLFDIHEYDDAHLQIQSHFVRTIDMSIVDEFESTL